MARSVLTTLLVVVIALASEGLAVAGALPCPLAMFQAFVGTSNHEEVRQAIANLGREHRPENIPLLESLASLRGADGRPTPEAREAATALSWGYGMMKYHRLYAGISDFAAFSAPGQISIVRMDKSGGANFLLGGPLTGKVIVRTVLEDSLPLWRRALEARQFWVQRGFPDYVPVEPIVPEREFRALIPKGIRDLTVKVPMGQARAYARVLGPSYEDVKNELTPAEREDLEGQMKAIEKGLIALGIDHGHAHTENYCVSRGPDGKPRIYVIDLDRARRIKGSLSEFDYERIPQPR